jgi:excisionase family DNA binding protein
MLAAVIKWVMTLNAPNRPSNSHSARCATAQPCMLSIRAVGVTRRALGSVGGQAADRRRRDLAGAERELFVAGADVKARVSGARSVETVEKSLVAFPRLGSLMTMATTKPPADPIAPVAASLLDAAEAGRLLSVPASWVLAEARANRIPHVRLGRYVRFSADELEAWWRARMRGPWRSRGAASRTARLQQGDRRAGSASAVAPEPAITSNGRCAR